MTSNTAPYVSPGMPPLTVGKQSVSAFEFWPTWAMYLPVVAQWLSLGVRHRSLTLPLLANPKLPLSGMVGIPKSQLFAQATGQCEEAILDWIVFSVDTANTHQAADVLQNASTQGLKLPLVCKPDIGCRGSGVKLIHHESQLTECINSYPQGTPLLLQKLSNWEPEVGIFFVKEPGAKAGSIISMALKYSPYVVGDGNRTLAELIDADERAGQLKHLYAERHSAIWDQVLAKGEPFKLVFSASHCRGAIFRDARDLITPELTDSINRIMDDLPEFYYGRMDVKFRDVESLKAGQTLEIVEINSASSESLHIWDKDTELTDAYRSLLFQYRTLFKLGQLNRQRGYRPPTLSSFYRAWKKERALQAYYPTTD